MVTVIFLAKKLARAGKPCLVTLLPGGVAWSVTLTSALGLHKAKGRAPGSVAEGKPTWEQGKQGKSGVGFFQGVPDLVRGGSSGGPWPGSSEQVSKVSLEFDFSRGFPTSFAVGIQVVRGLARRGGPRRRGQVPEPRSAPPGPTDANEPTESVARPVAEVPVAGADPPSLAPGRPRRTSQRTRQAGSLAKERSGLKPPKSHAPLRRKGGSREGFENLPGRGQRLLGDNPRGGQNFPPNSPPNNSTPAGPRPRTWKFFLNRAPRPEG